jgi:hypothetical protein
MRQPPEDNACRPSTANKQVRRRCIQRERSRLVGLPVGAVAGCPAADASERCADPVGALLWEVMDRLLQDIVA